MNWMNIHHHQVAAPKAPPGGGVEGQGLEMLPPRRLRKERRRKEIAGRLTIEILR